MRVLEVLTRHVASTRRDEPLVDAIQQMREEHVGALVVVEDRRDHGGGRMPIGILTDRDIVIAVLAKAPSHLRSLDVGDVMTADPVVATSEEDVSDVLRRMRKFNVRRVPVVDGAGTLQGIVTLDDVVAGLSSELAEAAALMSRQRDHEPVRRP